MKMVVTGATGYIGERLVSLAMSLGYEVVAASRKPMRKPIDWIPFDFTSKTLTSFPDGVNVVFHLAATTTTTIDPQVEISAASNLVRAAEQASAKFVFVSSQTACENAPTAYGRTKWQIEQIVLAGGGLVVRPGQVYGGAERGLFGVLVSVVRKLYIFPAFLPSPKIQPIHVDDLVLALLHCAESSRFSSSVFCVGAPLPISFTEFLRTIAIGRIRRFRLPIPIPVALITLTGFLIGRRLRGKLGIDRLTSLFNLPTMDTKYDIQALGVSLRSISSGISPSGDDRRRRLLRESSALLTYILRVKPTSALMRRYVRCIERVRNGQPLLLPNFMFYFPSTIAMLDESRVYSSAVSMELAWRLNMSVILSEASVQGATRFLSIGKTSGFLNSILNMTYALVLELSWRLLRLVLRHFLFRLGRLG